MSKVFKPTKFISLRGQRDLILELSPELRTICDEFNETAVKPYWEHDGKYYIKFHLIGTLFNTQKKQINAIQLIPRESVISGQFRPRVVVNKSDHREYVNLDLLIAKCDNIEADLFSQL